MSDRVSSYQRLCKPEVAEEAEQGKPAKSLEPEGRKGGAEQQLYMFLCMLSPLEAPPSAKREQLEVRTLRGTAYPDPLHNGLH